MPLVDKRAELHSYQCSLIQFHHPATKEVITIGIVLSDRTHNYLHIPKRFEKLKNCLDFQERAGINYTIDIIRDRIENQKFIPHGEVSPSVNIADPTTYRTELVAEDALHEAAERFMMVKKLREPDTDTQTAGRYDKLSILSMIEKRAEALHIENFMYHRRFDGVARKIIDLALVDDEKKPYSIANVAALHVNNFDDSFIAAAFTIEEAMRRDSIKDQFLYVPVMKENMTAKERKALGWAKEHAQHIGVDLITDSSHDAALERLNHFG